MLAPSLHINQKWYPLATGWAQLWAISSCVTLAAK